MHSAHEPLLHLLESQSHHAIRRALTSARQTLQIFDMQTGVGAYGHRRAPATYGALLSDQIWMRWVMRATMRLLDPGGGGASTYRSIAAILQIRGSLRHRACGTSRHMVSNMWDGAHHWGIRCQLQRLIPMPVCDWIFLFAGLDSLISRSWRSNSRTVQGRITKVTNWTAPPKF